MLASTRRSFSFSSSTRQLSPVTSHSSHVTGFTLVEMLVAISLLALLALIAWRGFDQISAQRARVDADTAATDRVMRTLAQMERDLAQRIPDALIAGSYGAGALASALQIGLDETGRTRIAVLRGYPGTSRVRSVTYTMEDARLMRRLTENDNDEEVENLMMLDAMSDFAIRLLVEGNWIEPRALKEVPPGGRAVAIEIAIEREGDGRYLQVLKI